MVSSGPRRLISPIGLGLVILFFAFPFFTVSYSSVVGDIDVTYSGMALAFDGTPSASGSLGSQLRESELEEARVGMPLQLISLITVLVGAVLSFVLPKPRARSISGLTCALVALLLVGGIQFAMKAVVENAMEEESGAVFVIARGVGEMSTSAGAGLWLALLALLGVAAYNMVTLSQLKQGSAAGVVPPGGMPPGGGQVPPGYGPPSPGSQGQYPQQGVGAQGPGFQAQHQPQQQAQQPHQPQQPQQHQPGQQGQLPPLPGQQVGQQSGQQQAPLPPLPGQQAGRQQAQLPPLPGQQGQSGQLPPLPGQQSGQQQALPPLPGQQPQQPGYPQQPPGAPR